MKSRASASTSQEAAWQWFVSLAGAEWSRLHSGFASLPPDLAQPYLEALDKFRDPTALLMKARDSAPDPAVEHTARTVRRASMEAALDTDVRQLRRITKRMRRNASKYIGPADLVPQSVKPERVERRTGHRDQDLVLLFSFLEVAERFDAAWAARKKAPRRGRGQSEKAANAKAQAMSVVRWASSLMVKTTATDVALAAIALGVDKPCRDGPELHARAKRWAAQLREAK